jgi:hypothetical protein
MTSARGISVHVTSSAVLCLGPPVSATGARRRYLSTKYTMSTTMSAKKNRLM